MHVSVYSAHIRAALHLMKQMSWRVFEGRHLELIEGRKWCNLLHIHHPQCIIRLLFHNHQELLDSGNNISLHCSQVTNVIVHFRISHTHSDTNEWKKPPSDETLRETSVWSDLSSLPVDWVGWQCLYLMKDNMGDKLVIYWGGNEWNFNGSSFC